MTIPLQMANRDLSWSVTRNDDARSEADREAILAPDDDFGADVPDAEKDACGLPVRGQQHGYPAARAHAEFVAQQVAGLGGPVGQRHR